MSGEAYLYKLRQINEARFDDQTRATTDDVLMLMFEVGNQLTYAASSDTCLGCADLRVVAALHEWLREGGAIEGATALARDREQNQCETCRARRAAIA